jgi:hypothetical protein
MFSLSYVGGQRVKLDFYWLLVDQSRIKATSAQVCTVRVEKRCQTTFTETALCLWQNAHFQFESVSKTHWALIDRSKTVSAKILSIHVWHMFSRKTIMPLPFSHKFVMGKRPCRRKSQRKRLSLKRYDATHWKRSPQVIQWDIFHVTNDPEIGLVFLSFWYYLLYPLLCRIKNKDKNIIYAEKMKIKKPFIFRKQR